jgi:hypothetical protein
MKTDNTNQQEINIQSELISFLVDTCEKNPNDQILGYKLRIFIKNLNDSVKPEVDRINL